MPGLDGTGPKGQRAMTGKRMGNCQKAFQHNIGLNCSNQNRNGQGNSGRIGMGLGFRHGQNKFQKTSSESDN